MPQDSFLGLMDMFDGGGAGRSGTEFEGGPLSDFLNSLGIRPAGYNDRLGDTRPRPRPQGLRPAMGTSPPPQLPPAPPNNPYFSTPPVTTTTLPPIGQMSDEQLIEMIRAAMERSGGTYDSGPR